MKKLMVIFVLTALLSGCLNEERTYYQEKKPNNSITLYSDGTYKLISNGYVWTGEYEEDENRVILKMNPPLPSMVGEKHGDNLTDPDGDNWIKKTA
jgi:hypothetical protein